jgi:PAS domain S-box-containing protein
MEKAIEPEVRDSAWKLLLGRHPEAVVAALAPDGFRIPMPESVVLPGPQILPVPADRATLIDLVVPEDAMTVITIWERARQIGLAAGAVRGRRDPDRLLTLTFIDARHRHGVWFGVLSEPDSGAGRPDQTADLAGLAVPVRPRTASIRKTAHAIITAIDDRTTRMLGWTAEQMVGARSSEFLHPDDRERAVANWMEMLSRQESQRVRLRHQCQDGSWLWVEMENIYEHAESFDDVVVMTQLSDISDEMAAHEALDQREKLFRRLAESLPRLGPRFGDSVPGGSVSWLFVLGGTH